MTDTYRTLRVARTDEGVITVVIDAPPMNLIGPELVRDFVALLSELAADEGVRVMVLESADPEYFVPHVDLTRSRSTPPKRLGPAGRTTRHWACSGISSASCRS